MFRDHNPRSALIFICVGSHELRAEQRMDDKVTTFTLMALDFTAYNKEPDKHTDMYKRQW